MFDFIKNLLETRKLKKHIRNSIYVDTLYSTEWLIVHHDRLIDCFPDMWTHIDNLDLTKFGFKMQLLGVPWETEEHLKAILTFFESLKMLSRSNDVLIRANPNNPIGEAAKNMIQDQNE